MAINKLSGNPFANIRTWLFERNKSITPNPFKPFDKKIVKDKKIDVANLQNILRKTHDPNGTINQLIDEVEDLGRRVSILEQRMDAAEFNIELLTERLTNLETSHTQDIDTLRTLILSVSNSSSRYRRNSRNKSNIGHTHEIQGAQFDTSPSTFQSGGRIKPSGGTFTKPVPLSKSQRAKLIDDILSNG